MKTDKTVPQTTIDKNGKVTTVHKNPNPVNNRAGRINDVKPRVSAVSQNSVAVEPMPYKEPKSSIDGMYIPGLDYLYDAYVDEFYPENHNYTYSVFEGLRLDPNINGASIVGHLFGINKSIPDDLMEYAREVGIEDPSNYQVHAQDDYYGQFASFTVSKEMMKKLRDWYFAHDNAVDNAGILPYVRSKGTETAGLDPLEAIKKQLAEENNGRTSDLVDKATSAIVDKVWLNRIRIPHQDRFDSVEPITSDDINAEYSQPILGVVYEVDESNYELIDGYHRLKGNKGRTGRFIVLK